MNARVSVEQVPSPSNLVGNAQEMRFASGLVMVRERYDVVSGEHSPVGGQGADQLQLHIRLSGDSRIQARGLREVDLRPATFTAFIHPGDEPKRHQFVRGQRYESVTVVCGPECAANLFGSDLDRMPRAIRNFAGTGGTGFYVATRPILAEMAFVARALLDMDEGSPIKPLYLESKSLELASYSLDALLAYDAGPAGALALSRGEQDRIRQVYELVVGNHVRPWPLKRIAEVVGMGEARMCTAFKAVYGITIYNLVVRCRMDHAIRLLTGSNASITDIALDLGYEYPGNFSTAFRKLYGISPSLLRKQGRTAIPPSAGGNSGGVVERHQR